MVSEPLFPQTCSCYANETRLQQEQRKFEIEIRNLVTGFQQSNSQNLGELQQKVDGKINDLQSNFNVLQGDMTEVKSTLKEILAKIKGGDLVQLGIKVPKLPIWIWVI